MFYCTILHAFETGKVDRVTKWEVILSLLDTELSSNTSEISGVHTRLSYACTRFILLARGLARIDRDHAKLRRTSIYIV